MCGCKGMFGKGIEERFWEKVAKKGDDECWLWFRGKDKLGYGRFYNNGIRSYLAHKFAYETVVGPVPDGMELDHACHNTSCVNPAHLRPATRHQNNGNRTLDPQNTSGLKGAFYFKRTGKWMAQIGVNGRSKYLGIYVTKEEAHAAYCQAAIKYFGEFANFGE